MDQTQAVVAIFDKYASAYQDKFMDVNLYHDTFDLFCALVGREHAEIFEIACGPGNVTRYLLDKRPDFRIFGIDIAPNMVELARINNPTARFEVMNAQDIASLKTKFDAVMCGFCLPYLSREEAIRLIGDVAGLLVPDGVFYLSTMEDDYSKSGLRGPSSGDTDLQLFMYYHQADYLLEALQESGFEVLDIRRKDYPDAQDATYKDLEIVAKRKSAV